MDAKSSWATGGSLPGSQAAVPSSVHGMRTVRQWIISVMAAHVHGLAVLLTGAPSGPDTIPFPSIRPRANIERAGWLAGLASQAGW